MQLLFVDTPSNCFHSFYSNLTRQIPEFHFYDCKSNVRYGCAVSILEIYKIYYMGQRFNRNSILEGYIDVGDECWRLNVLVTSLGCW